MPVSYVIDSVRRVIFIRAWGIVTDHELRQGTQALLADPQFDPAYGRLADFRDATEITARSDTVRATGAALSRGSPARRATVVATDVAYGLVRMSQFSAESPPELSLVCRDIDSALSWVGLPAGAPWPTGLPTQVHDDFPGRTPPSAGP